jgi:acetyl esterase/lipase
MTVAQGARSGLLAAVFMATACAGSQEPLETPVGATRPDRLAVTGTAPPDDAPPAHAGDAPPAAHGPPAADGDNAAPVAPSLPDGVEVGALDVIDVPDSRHHLRVIHAAASTRRALVYLHGMCGNIRSPEQWADVVSRYATLIALQGDLYCGRPGRYKWSRDIAALDQRVDEALAIVAERRGGLLDTDRVGVMGYSQGATRAAMLTQRAPAKYPWVIVAGIPATPRVDRVGLGEAIAVLGGEHEPTRHMRAGVRLLEDAGRNVRYFHLPGAEHGQYGPEGSRVVDEAFRFVFDASPHAPAAGHPG